MTQYFICRKITNLGAHDGDTGYAYYEPVTIDFQNLVDEIIEDYGNLLFRQHLKRGLMSKDAARYGIEHAVEYLFSEFGAKGP